MKVKFELHNDRRFEEGSFDKVKKIEDKLWFDLDIIPRMGELVDILNLISEEDYDYIEETSRCWSGSWGKVFHVELTRYGDQFNYEIWLYCEDE